MESICSYLPASILGHLILEEKADSSNNIDNKNSTTTNIIDQLPTSNSYETVVLFADVSGFTAMCEQLGLKGEKGNELLAKHLNSYFEMLQKIVSGQGGDVFKFAGDAIIVLWPPSPEDITSKVRRAAQCAVDISDKLQEAVMAEGVRLSVKVGIGVGNITILNVGGLLNRLEYLAIGNPLAQAFHAEHQATKREVVASPEAWKHIEEYFNATITNDGHAFLKQCIQPIRKVNIHKTAGFLNNITQNVINKAKRYVTPAIVDAATRNEDRWISEKRRITVLFVNLGVGESELVNMQTQKDFLHVHTIITMVQKAVYKYEGSLNKFLMDDKGSTLIAVFGLPPCSHDDDSIRGILAANEIYFSLANYGLRASIGVTTGPAFCGVIGARGRREYSILGDIVNLSARLMQHATINATGVLIGPNAYKSANKQLSSSSNCWIPIQFFPLNSIKVKGKSKPIKIYKPFIRSHQENHFITLDILRNNIPKLLLSPIKSYKEDACNLLQSLEHNILQLSIYNQILNILQANSSTTNSCILLSSEWGLGKTHLLYTLIVNMLYNDSQQLRINAKYLLLAKGNTYKTRTNSYDIWKQILIQLLTQFYPLETDYHILIRELLQHQLSNIQQISCLNDLSSNFFHFEENRYSKSLNKEQRLQILKRFILFYLVPL